MSSHHVLPRLCCSALAAALLVAPSGDTQARNKPCKRIKRPNEQALVQAKLFDIRRNTVGNVDFFITNYGIFGLDVERNTGGVYWPRGSSNQYVFGGGMWFGAQKRVDGTMRKLVVMSYDPNSGGSWFVPGVYSDGEEIDVTYEGTMRNALYLSTDYTDEGTYAEPGDRKNWPLWHTRQGEQPGMNGYAGDFIADPGQRSMTVYPGGPVVLSDEDIVTAYRDSDLNYYAEGVVKAKAKGYPLGIEVVQSVYSWKDGDLKDAVILRYECTNRSVDTLYDCWFAPAMDFDLAVIPQQPFGSGNDRVRFYDEDPSLNLAVQWTNTDRGEAGKGFGYAGMAFLSAPAVDGNGYLRRDKQYFDHDEQLGLATFRNWVIENDPKDELSRYDFISSAVREPDNGPGDKRFLMAAGPFHLLPGEEATFAVALVFAEPALGEEATGETGDPANLAALVRKVRERYDESLASGVVSVADDATGSGGVRIDGVYPNPAATTARVEFALGAPAETTIDVVDVTGRVVLSQRVRLNAGRHTLAIDAAALRQGVYTCRIAANGAVKSTMLSVVR